MKVVHLFSERDWHIKSVWVPARPTSLRQRPGTHSWLGGFPDEPDRCTQWPLSHNSQNGQEKQDWGKFDIQVNLDMTDHCKTDFRLWRTICLVPVPCISSICHMYMTDFAYDGPIFLVPLSLSYPSSPVLCQIYERAIWPINTHSDQKHDEFLLAKA